MLVGTKNAGLAPSKTSENMFSDTKSYIKKEFQIFHKIHILSCFYQFFLLSYVEKWDFTGVSRLLDQHFCVNQHSVMGHARNANFL